VFPPILSAVFILNRFPYLSALPGVDAAGVEEAHDPRVLSRNPEDLSLRITLVQRRASAVTKIGKGHLKTVILKTSFKKRHLKTSFKNVI
jgi:hypothetical protein